MLPVWRLTPLKFSLPPSRSAVKHCGKTNLRQTQHPCSRSDPLDRPETGRTFVSNNTTGATFEYAYYDNDGDPGGLTPLGWTELALAVPNGGADHETIGSGPYRRAQCVINEPINHGSPVLLLFTRTIVGPAHAIE